MTAINNLIRTQRFTVLGYILTREAVEALQLAKDARGADKAYQDHADYVEQKDRLKVWNAVDNLTVF